MTASSSEAGEEKPKIYERIVPLADSKSSLLEEIAKDCGKSKSHKDIYKSAVKMMDRLDKAFDEYNSEMKGALRKGLKICDKGGTEEKEHLEEKLALAQKFANEGQIMIAQEGLANIGKVRLRYLNEYFSIALPDEAGTLADYLSGRIDTDTITSLELLSTCKEHILSKAGLITALEKKVAGEYIDRKMKLTAMKESYSLFREFKDWMTEEYQERIPVSTLLVGICGGTGSGMITSVVCNLHLGIPAAACVPYVAAAALVPIAVYLTQAVIRAHLNSDYCNEKREFKEYRRFIVNQLADCESKVR